MSIARQSPEEVQSAFKDAAQRFYNHVHDIIPDTQGDDAITRTAMERFIDPALLALSHDGLPIDVDDKQVLADFLCFKFLSALQPEQANDVNTHQELYIAAFAEKLDERYRHRQMRLEGDELLESLPKAIVDFIRPPEG